MTQTEAVTVKSYIRGARQLARTLIRPLQDGRVWKPRDFGDILEHRGWIEAEWAVSELGRRAKYYRLTGAGRRQLAVETRAWERMAAAIGRVMKLA